MPRTDQIKIERRYLWEVPVFTPKDDVYKLLVQVEPGHSAVENGFTWFTRIELFDTKARAPLIDLQERKTHKVHRQFAMGDGLAGVLCDALYAEQLRGDIENHAVWVMVWSMMTEGKQDFPWRSSELARKWVPEWAAWLDGLKMEAAR